MRECFGTLFFCGKGARTRSQIDYTTKIAVYLEYINQNIFFTTIETILRSNQYPSSARGIGVKYEKKYTRSVNNKSEGE